MQYSKEYLNVLNHVLEIEGAPTNHGWDPGGATAFGISKNFWPQYWEDGPPDYETAKRFYWTEFWCALRLPEVQNAHLRAEIFEASVNCGYANGAKFAQSAYNMLRPRSWPVLRKKDGTPGADGDIGPKSLAALNQMSIRYVDALLAGCNYFQAKYYEGMNEDLKEEALRGWFGKRLAWPIK